MALGSIVVRLTMNTADFDTDTARAAKIAERRAKEIDASFRKASLAIGLALGAAAVGAAVAIKNTINTMDDLSKAAQRANVPTEEFTSLAYAGGLACNVALCFLLIPEQGAVGAAWAISGTKILMAVCTVGLALFLLRGTQGSADLRAE